METSDINSIVILLIKIIMYLSYALSVDITNGPQDIVVCMNVMAECDCGFTGIDPRFALPNWRIVFRSDNGSIISDDTHNGLDISEGLINGLQWLLDPNNSSNSKLLVGPVNKTHNQSSYQCMIRIREEDPIMSSVGTMTVMEPSVIINVDEICTTSIIISLNTYSHPACGDVSHNVTISGNVIYPNIVGGSKYTIDQLQSDTLYNITVTTTYNSGSRIFAKSVRALLPKFPNPVDVTGIKIENISNTDVRIMWQPPEINKCSMTEIKHYDVIISVEDKIVSKGIVNETMLTFQYLDDHSNVTIMVNITVVDIKGQRSISTVAMKTISIGTEREMISETNTNENNIKHCEIFIGLAVMLLVTSVILAAISVILCWKLYNYKRKFKNDAVLHAISPVQLQRQLNVDDIKMQPSPAYVSIDNKSPQLYQNI